MKYPVFVKCVLFAFVIMLMAALCFAKGLLMKGAPDWVEDWTEYKKTQGMRLFQAVSSAPLVGDAELQNAIAEKRARKKLNRVFSAYTDSLSNDYRAPGHQHTNKGQFNDLGKVVLPEAKIVARWRDKRTGLLFFHIQIDLTAVKKIVANNQGIDPAIQSYLEKNGEDIFDRLLKGQYQKATKEPQPLETARQKGCLACHKIEGKLIGPAFSWIAYKYKDDKKNGKNAIVDSIINGSKNKWVMSWGIPMPPVKKITEAQCIELADYILSLDPIAPPQ
jgi:cytochrome c